MGFADAILLAKEGAKVVATDLDADTLQEAYKDAKGEISTMVLDVTDKDNWEKVVNATIDKYGKIDILVNNAGIHIAKNVLEAEIDDFNKVMEINTTGVFLGMKTVVPHMRKNKGGSIVNISSLAGLLGGPKSDGGGHAYSASKGAVRSMTKNVAQDFAAEGIRANTIHPGPIFTPIMEKTGMTLEDAQETYGKFVPLTPHVGSPEDIANGVLYLASDESRFITSQELVIDGGFATQ
jgi:NAD(P)-dependent dehydrogenase (short-subunit alcohol dehydrogenase family)